MAQLAGMPRPVVERAKELLISLEGESINNNKRTAIAPSTPKTVQSTLLEVIEHPLLEALRKLEVDDLSPIQALTKLYELKKMAT